MFIPYYMLDADKDTLDRLFRAERNCCVLLYPLKPLEFVHTPKWKFRFDIPIKYFDFITLTWRTKNNKLVI